MIARLAEKVSNAPSTARWHIGRLASRTVYSTALGALGRGSVIVSPLRIQGSSGIRIGRDTIVREGSWLATEDGGSLLIGDHCYVGHDVHVHAIDDIEIGTGCVIADGVFIATSDHDRGDRHAVHGTGPISIAQDVFIGQRAIILGGVSIGAGATIGAGAVVTQNVDPGTVVAGVPARVLH